MVAISDNVKGAMQQNISVLRDRMACLIPFQATHDECLELVAPPEHLDMLRQASKYADAHSSESWMQLSIPGTLDGVSNPSVCLLMRTHGGKSPPLKPREPQWNADKPLAVRVMDWTLKSLELHRKSALARHVVGELARRCETGAQVRFMWPCVLHLCQPLADGLPYNMYNERLTQWADRNGPFKAQRSVPSLSHEMRKALIETSGFITAASLLSKDLVADPVEEVNIALSGSNSFEFEGVTIFRG